MIPTMQPVVAASMLIFATATANLRTYVSHSTVSVHLGLSSWIYTSSTGPGSSSSSPAAHHVSGAGKCAACSRRAIPTTLVSGRRYFGRGSPGRSYSSEIPADSPHLFGGRINPLQSAGGEPAVAEMNFLQHSAASAYLFRKSFMTVCMYILYRVQVRVDIMVRHCDLLETHL